MFPVASCPAGHCAAMSREGVARRKTAPQETACQAGASDQGSARTCPLAFRKTATARLTAARTACRPTGPADLAQSSCATLASHGLELSGQEFFGVGWLPELGMQVFHLHRIDFRGFPATALEHAGSASKQSPFPLRDHCGRNPEPAGQLADHLQRITRRIHFYSGATFRTLKAARTVQLFLGENTQNERLPRAQRLKRGERFRPPRARSRRIKGAARTAWISARGGIAHR